MRVCGVLLCVSMVCALPARGEERMPGGLSEVPVDDKDIVAAAQFAVSAHAKELTKEAAPKGGAMTLVKIVKARQQVVAGINYRLELKVSVDGAEKEAEAVVWKQLSGAYKLTSWTWKKGGEAKQDAQPVAK